MTRKTKAKKVVVKEGVVKRAPRAATPKPPLKMYRTISVLFVLVVAIVLGVVIYVSTVQATIFVTSETKSVESDFLFDVVRTPTKDHEIRGRVLSATISRSKTFEPGGDGIEEVPGVARGMVTLHNESSSAQPLVKTTRLWSPDGVQFRIDKDVTVPAKGTIDVDAYADFEGAGGNIEPTRFSIPGLAEAKQAVIYATSSEPFAGGLSRRAVISQQDIDLAKGELRDELSESIRSTLREQAGDVYSGEAFLSEVNNETSSVSAGEEANAFVIQTTVQVVGVFFDRSALDEVAVSELYARLTQGFDFVEVNPEQSQIVVERYDTEAEQANMRARLSARSIASTTSEALDPGRFVGMSAQQIEDLLVNEGVATDVDVEFRPAWVKRAPSLKDHIFVEIR